MRAALSPRIALPVTLAAEFRLRDIDGKSVEVLEGARPVFVYNYGTMLKDGVPADRARCCYVHPAYAPNGVAVTDDFPKDHYHHRGISWMWPKWGRRLYVRSLDHQRSSRDVREVDPEGSRSGPGSARLSPTGGMSATGVVEEQVEIVAHPARLAPGSRLHRAISPVDGANVEISGDSPTRKDTAGSTYASRREPTP